MTDLLSEVEYGRILGSFTAVSEDFGDTVAPEAIPLSGRVTFVPSKSNISYINSEGETASLYVAPVNAVISQGRIVGKDGKDGVVLLASDSNNVSASVLWTARINLDPVNSGDVVPETHDFLIEVRRGEIASLIDVIKENSRVHNIALFHDAIAEAAAKFWERVESGEFRGNQGPPGPAGIGIGVAGPAGRAGKSGRDGDPGVGGNLLPDGNLEEPGFLVAGDMQETSDAVMGNKAVTLSKATSRKIFIEPEKSYVGSVYVKSADSATVSISQRVFGLEGDIDRVIENSYDIPANTWKKITFLLDTNVGDQSMEIVTQADGRTITVDQYTLADNSVVKGLQKELTSAKSLLEARLAQLDSELAEVDSERQRLATSLNDLATVLEDGNVDLTALNEDMASLKEGLATEQTARQEADAAAQLVIEQLDSNLADAKIVLDQHKATMESLDLTLEESQAIINDSKAKIEELETQTLPNLKKNLEDADAAAQETLAELDARIDTMPTEEALATVRSELADARGVADAAKVAAEEANTAANAASQAALEAAGIASSKGRIIVQETEPQGEDRTASNIWIKPIPDDPTTEIEEKAITYVYLEASDEWQPTTSSELAQAAQNALDAREAAQQAQQRADTAIANAATAQSAAEAAQRTANQATLDARGAHNEAVAAQASADDAMIRATSPTANMIHNGSGRFGMENFEGPLISAVWERFPDDAPSGAVAGYGRPAGRRGPIVMKLGKRVSIDPARRYKMTAHARQANPDYSGSDLWYMMLEPFDADGGAISPWHVARYAGTLTTLAAPLKTGDTTVTLTSGENWTAATSNRFIAVYNYVDGSGKAWGTQYTRQIQTFVSVDGSTATLSAPWSFADAPAGTPVAQGLSGNSFIYPMTATQIPKQWTAYESRIVGGVTPEGKIPTLDFPAPTASVLPGFLLNYTGQTESEHRVGNIGFFDVTEAVTAQAAAEAAQERADAAMAEASTAKGLAENAVREVGDTVRDTVIEYAVNTSETVAPTSGWSTSTPTRTPGSFVWMRTIVTYADGDTSTTSPALLTGNAGATGATGPRGADGIAGKDGVGLSGTALAYALSTSGTVAPTTGWTATVPTPIKGRYLWTRTTWAYSDNTSEVGYSVAYLATDGAKGNDGIAGKDGVGITGTAITYAVSSSGTTAPSSGWVSSPPAASAGQFMWTKTVWSYSDSTTETGYSVGKIGNTGATGPKGDQGSQGIQGPKGADGQPTYTWLKYADTPTSGMSDSPEGKKYLGLAHNKTTAAESSSYSDYSWSLIEGPQGNQGIQGPKGSDGQTTYTWIKYGTSATGAGISDSPVGKTYIGIAYNKTTATESNTASDYEWSLIQGPQGDTGATGVSITSVTPYFRAVARTAAAPAQPSGMTPSGWVTNEPAWSPSNKLYRAERIVYSNGTVSWTASTLVAAYEGIVQVQTSVNGKNSITRSTANASGTGVAVGDAWYKVDSNGDTMAMWIWSGSAWVASKVRNEMIDTVDVNKLKVFGAATMEEAVINKIWADGIAARAIDTSRLTVSSGNIYVDPMLEDRTRWGSTGVHSTTGGKSGGASLSVTSTTNGSYDTFNLARLTQVTPGKKYRLGTWIKSSATGNSYGRLNAGFRTSAGSTVGPAFVVVQGGALVADEWKWIEGVVTVPEGADRLYIGYFNSAPEGVTVTYSDPVVTPMVGSVLIEDGAVNADKINAESVAAAVGQFVEVEAGNIVAGSADIDSLVAQKIAGATASFQKVNAGNIVSSSAAIDQAVINQIWADGIAAKALTTNKLVVATGNLVPDGDEMVTEEQWAPLTRDLTDKPASTIAARKTAPGQGNAANIGNQPFPVTPGQEYSVQTWVKADKPGSVLYIEIRDTTTGAHAGTVTITEPVTANTSPYFLFSKQEVPTEWTLFRGTWTPNEGVTSVRLGTFYFNHSAGSERGASISIAGLSIRPKVGAVLIENGAISSNHLTTNSVDTGHLRANAVSAEKILAGAVTTDKMVANSISGDRIKANTLDAGKITARTITATQIKAGAISATEIASRTITADKIVAGSITSNEIKARTITAAEIATGTITANEISAQALTVIGQTVVNDINVKGKLIGTDGVFTGTVDFANVNVTGTQIVNTLGAHSITAEMINGGRFTGEIFVGGTFTGGVFETSDAVPGQVTLSDTAGVFNGTAVPGIQVEPIDPSGYSQLPFIGPDQNGMVIAGGRSTSGATAGASLRNSHASLYYNGPITATSSTQSVVQARNDGVALIYRPDGVNRPGVSSRLSAFDGSARLRAEDGGGYSQITTSPNGSDMYVTDGSGNEAWATADMTLARLAYSSKNSFAKIEANDNEAIIWREKKVNGVRTRYDIFAFDDNGLTYKQADINPDGTYSNSRWTKFGDTGWVNVTPGAGVKVGEQLAYRIVNSVCYWRGIVYGSSSSNTLASGSTTIMTVPAAVRPRAVQLRPTATNAAVHLFLQVDPDGRLSIWSSAATLGWVHINCMSYALG